MEKSLENLEGILKKLESDEKKQIALIKDAFKIERSDLAREVKSLRRTKRKDDWQKMLVDSLGEIEDDWHDWKARCEKTGFAENITSSRKCQLPNIGPTTAHLEIYLQDTDDPNYKQMQISLVAKKARKVHQQKFLILEGAYADIQAMVSLTKESVQKGKLFPIARSTTTLRRKYLPF